MARPFRRQGLTVRLLKAAVEFATGQGATIVEGYPVVPHTARMPGPSAFHGLLSAYLEAGFVEVARPAEHRAVVRYYLNRGADGGSSA